MFSRIQITSRSGGSKASLRRRPQGLRYLFSLLGMLAIFLNLLVPMTHNAFAQGMGDEAFVEVCTQNGIEKINAAELLSPGETLQKNSEGFCDACPDCPLCWYGTAAALKVYGLGYPYIEDRDPNVIAIQSTPSRMAALHWTRPALRAPPAFI